MKFRTAVTVFYEGRYVPPGTLIDLPEDEVRSIIERFGEAPADMTISQEDIASVEQLNVFQNING